MIDKSFCMSSYLSLRYIEKASMDFSEKLSYRHPSLPEDSERILVKTADDIGNTIINQLEDTIKKCKKVGILLSGGMDSAILASYLPGAEAYTFRFMGGEFQEDELNRAKYYANQYDLNLHYVDINWELVNSCLEDVMISKGGPVHSIEPQIYASAKMALSDGIDLMIIGDGSDYVFGGMDKLLSKDWTFEEFYHRYIYIEPEEVLKDPKSIRYLFERYRQGNRIDFIKFMEIVATEESYGSYSNAFHASGLNYFDPYERLKMVDPLDLTRIRNGESKYLIRELFKKRYPDIPVPEKLPMPRPVDIYFANWGGPTRSEFRDDISINKYSGNQKWLMWCLEEFLNLLDGMAN